MPTVFTYSVHACNDTVDTPNKYKKFFANVCFYTVYDACTHKLIYICVITACRSLILTALEVQNLCLSRLYVEHMLYENECNFCDPFAFYLVN